jgi:opacity protein-like surface antigen
MRISILLALFATANAFAAGPFIVGGRGGTGLDVSKSNNTFSSVTRNLWGHNLAVGPTVGVRLPGGLSVEGDALYNRRSLGLGGLSGLGGLVSSYTRSEWWEFPVMLKYTGGNGPIAPVVGGGITAQHISNFGTVPSYVFSGRTSANSVGFVAGAGVQFRAGAMAVTPEFRYTRRTGSSWRQSLVDTVVGSQNQAQFLVGVTF